MVKLKSIVTKIFRLVMLNMKKIGKNEDFRMLVVVKSDEKNYFCDFFCNSNNRKEYSSRLLEWSKTIKIDQFD